MRNISFCDSQTLISRMSFYLYLDWSCTIPWNSWNNCNVLTTRWHCEIAHIAEAPIGVDHYWGQDCLPHSSGPDNRQLGNIVPLQLYNFIALWYDTPVQYKEFHLPGLGRDLEPHFLLTWLSLSVLVAVCQYDHRIASQLLSLGERGSKPKLQSLSATTWANLIVPPLILLVCSFSMF